MPTLDTLLNAFVTLLVTTDPIGNAPIFLALTTGLSVAQRRGIAIRGSVIAFCILSTFALTGMAVLDAMGITIDAFRVAGGLLLFYTAFEMIYGGRQERKAEVGDAVSHGDVVKDDSVMHIAVFPLAIPFIAGPGTISATILLSSELSSASDTSAWFGRLILVGLILTLMLITAATLIAAEALDKYIGNTGKLVITRLLGVLLAALSVQYVADGARALFG